MATMVTLGSPARAPKMQRTASRDSLPSVAPQASYGNRGPGLEGQPGGHQQEASESESGRLAEGSEAGPRGLFVLACEQPGFIQGSSSWFESSF